MRPGIWNPKIQESGGTENGYILENRLEDEQADASARKGLRIVMGVLAGILACVGIAGILSTTLGQLYQRKKEFARYVSIGVSPDEIKKMLFMEALFIVGRPFLLALLIDIPVTVLLLHAAPVTAGGIAGTSAVDAGAPFTGGDGSRCGDRVHGGGREDMPAEHCGDIKRRCYHIKFSLEHFLKIHYNNSDNNGMLPELSDSMDETNGTFFVYRPIRRM